jgi:hypothetical protein
VPQQRGGDELPLAGALAREERRRDRAGQGHARAVIAHTPALEGRHLALARERRRDARARPEGGNVVGRLVAVGTLRAVATDGAVDELRVLGEQGLRVESGAGQCPAAHVGQEDVGSCDELPGQRAALIPREVDRHAALVAIVHLERRVEGQVAAEHTGEGARRVADAGRLDLYHVGAPVRQDQTRRRARHPDTELHDPHSVHRSGHARSSGAPCSVQGS